MAKTLRRSRRFPPRAIIHQRVASPCWFIVSYNAIAHLSAAEPSCFHTSLFSPSTSRSRTFGELSRYAESRMPNRGCSGKPRSSLDPAYVVAGGEASHEQVLVRRLASMGYLRGLGRFLHESLGKYSSALAVASCHDGCLLTDQGRSAVHEACIAAFLETFRPGIFDVGPETIFESHRRHFAAAREFPSTNPRLREPAFLERVD